MNGLEPVRNASANLFPASLQQPVVHEAKARSPEELNTGLPYSWQELVSAFSQILYYQKTALVTEELGLKPHTLMQDTGMSTSVLSAMPNVNPARSPHNIILTNLHNFVSFSCSAIPF